MGTLSEEEYKRLLKSALFHAREFGDYYKYKDLSYDKFVEALPKIHDLIAKGKLIEEDDKIYFIDGDTKTEMQFDSPESLSAYKTLSNVYNAYLRKKLRAQEAVEQAAEKSTSDSTQTSTSSAQESSSSTSKSESQLSAELTEVSDGKKDGESDKATEGKKDDKLASDNEKKAGDSTRTTTPTEVYTDPLLSEPWQDSVPPEGLWREPLLRGSYKEEESPAWMDLHYRGLDLDGASDVSKIQQNMLDSTKKMLEGGTTPDSKESAQTDSGKELPDNYKLSDEEQKTLNFLLELYNNNVKQTPVTEAAAQETLKSTRELLPAVDRSHKMSDEFSGTDIANLAALGLDVASLVTAAAGPVSAGISLAATLTLLGANIADDNVSAWDTAKQAVIGAGLSAAGLIPGGSLAKVGRVGQQLVKWIPRALKAAAQVGLFESAPELAKQVGQVYTKCKNQQWSDITIDELKAVGTVLTAVAGGVRSHSARTARKQAADSKGHVFSTSTTVGKKNIGLTDAEIGDVLSSYKGKEGASIEYGAAKNRALDTLNDIYIQKTVNNMPSRVFNAKNAGIANYLNKAGIKYKHNPKAVPTTRAELIKQIKLVETTAPDGTKIKANSRIVTDLPETFKLKKYKSADGKEVIAPTRTTLKIGAWVGRRVDTVRNGVLNMGTNPMFSWMPVSELAGHLGVGQYGYSQVFLPHTPRTGKAALPQSAGPISWVNRLVKGASNSMHSGWSRLGGRWSAANLLANQAYRETAFQPGAPNWRKPATFAADIDRGLLMPSTPVPATAKKARGGQIIKALEGTIARGSSIYLTDKGKLQQNKTFVTRAEYEGSYNPQYLEELNKKIDALSPEVYEELYAAADKIKSDNKANVLDEDVRAFNVLFNKAGLNVNDANKNDGLGYDEAVNQYRGITTTARMMSILNNKRHNLPEEPTNTDTSNTTPTETPLETPTETPLETPKEQESPTDEAKVPEYDPSIFALNGELGTGDRNIPKAIWETIGDPMMRNAYLDRARKRGLAAALYRSLMAPQEKYALHDNWATKQAALQAQAKLYSAASQIDDATLRQAAQVQAALKAADIALQSAIATDQYNTKADQEAQAVENRNELQRVATANQNMLLAAKTDEARATIEDTHDLATTTNRRNAIEKGIGWMDKFIGERKQRDFLRNRDELEDTPTMLLLKKNYQEAVDRNDSDAATAWGNQINNLRAEQQQYVAEHNTEAMINLSGYNVGRNNQDLVVRTAANSTASKKNGGAFDEFKRLMNHARNNNK